MRLEIVSTDIGPDEVVPQIALLDDSDETVAVVVGERTAQLFAAAEEMLAEVNNQFIGISMPKKKDENDRYSGE